MIYFIFHRDVEKCPKGHRRDTRKRKAVGHHSPKGGDAYAYYSDIPCVWIYHHSENQDEKRQPPLWQVTVVNKNNLIF